MSVDARREQMLEIGINLIATQRVEDVSIDDVIEKAGVSRALFYHYFDSKRDFFLQTVQLAADAITDATKPDPKASPIEQLEAAIDAYFDFVSAHSAQYRAVYQSLFSGDPEIQAILRKSQDGQERRMLEALARNVETTDLVRVAVHGWLAFLVSSCLNWLETGTPDRESLRDLCRDVLIAAIASAS
jgi:AcrR family transcriptional regulator